MKSYLKDVQKALDAAPNLSTETRQRIGSLAAELKDAVDQENHTLIQKRYLALKVLRNQHIELHGKSTLREYGESIGLAIAVALILRAFVFEAFKIPTGSMIPTLEVGDRLFVNKFVYGVRIPLTDRYLVHFAEPKAGEVVVFSFPNEEAKAYLKRQPHSMNVCIDVNSLDEEKDFIKRIVGVEGDTVEIRNNRLFINGTPLKRMKEEKPSRGDLSGYLYPIYREREVHNGQVYTVQFGGKDPNFGPVKVKDGHVFVMGDNRDNSADSRCWGQVPVENIKGRAMFIWMSVKGGSFDFSRFGHGIHESSEEKGK